MQLLSKKMEETIENSSMIRKMFEAGAELKAKYGVDKVCDFSLGNPDLAPPPCVASSLAKIAQKSSSSFALGYMQNAGFDFVRRSLANYLSKEQNIELTENDVFLTCGAAGAMHVFLYSVLNTGDEILGISPFFVDYKKYIECNNGVFKVVPAHQETFLPNIEALENAINEKTRALLINSPNNPTGIIYSEEVIQSLINLVEKASKKYGKMIYLISDEPYRFLAYDTKVPSLLDKTAHAVVISSFSKNLSLAGERVGYIALSPLLEKRNTLIAGFTQANRFLGFINAPVIGQYIIGEVLACPSLQESLDKATKTYKKRRDTFIEIFKNIGIEYTFPQGAFYLFIKSPTEDESIFVDALKDECILAVPGSGFGCKGYVRLSYAVEDAVIERSAQGFKKAFEKCKK